MVIHVLKQLGFSSSRIWPYASRFILNSKKLCQLGFHVPIVFQAYCSKDLACDILIYHMIQGPTFREYCNKNDVQPFFEMAAFLASLHQSGVYFRDLHFGNFIVTKKDFALIDLASVRIKTRSLSLRMRARNFAHLLNNVHDYSIVNTFGTDRFLRLYQSYAELSEDQFSRMNTFLWKRVQKV